MELIRSGLFRGSGFPLYDVDGDLGCSSYSFIGIHLEDAKVRHVDLQELATFRSLSQHGECFDGIQAGLSQGGAQQIQEWVDGFCVQGCILPCKSPAPGTPEGASAPPPLTPCPPLTSSLCSLRGGTTCYLSSLHHPHAGPCILLYLQPRPGPLISCPSSPLTGFYLSILVPVPQSSPHKAT